MPKDSTNTGSPFGTSMTATTPYSPAKSINASPGGWRYFADYPIGTAADYAVDAECEESVSMPTRIPRPLNKFMLFRKAMCNRDLPQLADVVTAAEKSKVIGQLWKALNEEEKRKWGERAEVAKQEHERKYPGYKYQPQPKHLKKRKARFVGSDSKDQSYDGPASHCSMALSQLARHIPITQTVSEPPRNAIHLQPEPNAFEADWFDFVGFEKQSHSGRSSASDHGLQQFPHHTDQVYVSMPAAAVGQPNFLPSIAWHARSDAFGGYNGSILTSNKTSYEFSASLASDVDLDSLIVQWPTAETYLGGNVADSFVSPGNGPSCLIDLSSGSREERIVVSPRPYWDSVTPDQPKDERFTTPWSQDP